MNNWDVAAVGDWLDSIGLGKFITIFEQNNITGDVLIHADHDMLKELEMGSIGQRLTLLKEIYNFKIREGIEIEDGDYVPESEMKSSAGIRSPKNHDDWPETPEISEYVIRNHEQILAKLEKMIVDRDEEIRRLTDSHTKLSFEFSHLKSDLQPIWGLISDYKMFQKMAGKNDKNKKTGDPLTPEHATRPLNSSDGKNASVSPYMPASMKSPVNSLKLAGDDHSSVGSASPAPMSPLKTRDPDVDAIRIYGHRLPNRENVSYKSFRVHVNDDCLKLIPQVLRKYGIQDDWKQYAIFLQYKEKEQCLSFDERPLAILNSVKGSDDVPEFYLKHIKHVRSIESRSNATSLVSELDTKSFASAALHSRNQSSTSNESITTTDTAVAIYEYKAQRVDEFDVTIGDNYHIISREMGWYVVEKNGRSGWVPAGCLLENSEPTTDIFKTSNRIGKILFDYQQNSPNELTIHKGENVTIHKKYQHWLLVDYKDLHGWVPSCYISVENEPSTDEPLEMQNQNQKTLQVPVNEPEKSLVRNRSKTYGGEDLEQIQNESNFVKPRYNSKDSLNTEQSKPNEGARIVRSVSLSNHQEKDSKRTKNAVSKLSNLLDVINPFLLQVDSSQSSFSADADMNLSLPYYKDDSPNYSDIQTEITNIEQMLLYWREKINALSPPSADIQKAKEQLAFSNGTLNDLRVKFDASNASQMDSTYYKHVYEVLQALCLEEGHNVKNVKSTIVSSDPTGPISSKLLQERNQVILSSVQSTFSALTQVLGLVKIEEKSKLKSKNKSATNSHISMESSLDSLEANYNTYSKALGSWGSPASSPKVSVSDRATNDKEEKNQESIDSRTLELKKELQDKMTFMFNDDASLNDPTVKKPKKR